MIYGCGELLIYLCHFLGYFAYMLWDILSSLEFKFNTMKQLGAISLRLILYIFIAVGPYSLARIFSHFHIWDGMIEEKDGFLMHYIVGLLICVVLLLAGMALHAIIFHIITGKFPNHPYSMK